MTWFLDTNICIYALKGTRAGIAERLAEMSPAQIRIPAIVRGELRFGACKSRDPRRTLQIIEAFLAPFELAPFGARESDVYGDIRAALEGKGKVIGPNDLILAATVLAADGVLVTHNTREFRRVQGLRCEDWVAS